MAQSLSEIAPEIYVDIKEVLREEKVKSVELQSKFIIHNNYSSTLFDNLKKEFKVDLFLTSSVDKYRSLLNDYTRLRFGVKSNDIFSTCNPKTVIDELTKILSKKVINFNWVKISMDWGSGATRLTLNPIISKQLSFKLNQHHFFCIPVIISESKENLNEIPVGFFLGLLIKKF